MPSGPDAEFLPLQEALAVRYSIERELGRGGMGIVYLAYEVALDRPVALKLLPGRHAAEPALRERFLREARMAAKLSHPHIVPIYAVDQIDNFVFFAMAFVDGETLGHRVRTRGPVPASDAVRVLREVAWALAYAHAQGVIHRDIKPDNILLETNTGRAMVTDFGIARPAEGGGLTSEGEVLGTAEFMSPEQASGEAVDGRSDLYSLGCVAYYLMSGRLPLEGATVAATLAKHITQVPAPLAGVAPDVPSRVGRAIDKCLAKSPEDRFPTGEALAEALAEGAIVRRELPAPLRVFLKRSREAYGSAGAVALVGFFLVPWFFGTLASGAWGASLIVGALGGAILFGPAVSVGFQLRKLAKAGFGLEDLRLALREDAARRQEELRFEYGGSSGLLARVARPVFFTSLITLVGSVATVLLVPGLRGSSALWSTFGISLGTFGVSGAIVARHHERTRDVWGRRLLKFWNSRVGGWFFRLFARGVHGGISAGGATHRPTELAIGLAADRLYEDLPKAVRAQFPALPTVVRRLEADAHAMRARVEELNVLLAEAGGGRTSAAADRRADLTDRLARLRDDAQARLKDAVTALETVRLNLLRMHAGVGTAASVTADLAAAREVSDAVARLAAGRAEVEAMLQDGRKDGKTEGRMVGGP